MKFVFQIVPASNGPIYLAGCIALLLLGLVLLFGYLAYSSRNAEFILSQEGLRIKRDLYGRLVPLSSIDFENIRALDLTRDGEYRMKWRTNGAGLPGYRAGWFKLRNGEKALAFVTDMKRVVYVPTRDGYSVLMSVPDPHRFQEAFKQMQREL